MLSKIKDSIKKDPTLISLLVYGLGSIIGIFTLFYSLSSYEDSRMNKIKKILDDTSIVKTDVLGHVREIIVDHEGVSISFEYDKPTAVQYILHKSKYSNMPSGYILIIEKVE